MAVLFYPILLKTLIYAAEPIGLKGGTLFRIPKPGAPDPAALSSHRAILVQSVLEKVLHKAVRPMTVREWDKRAPSLMIGGRKGLSYMVGYFCTRAFLEYTRRRSIPAAILFTDISSAYYSVVRELITGQHGSSAPVTEIAANLALSPEDLQQLQHYVSEEPVLSGEGAGDLLRVLARELHCSTWFVMHQDSAVVRTQRGTRPGSSLADVCMVCCLRRCFNVEGTSVTRDGSRRFPGTAPDVFKDTTAGVMMCSKSRCRIWFMQMILLRVS